jgi:hypothetical protein
MIPEYKENSPLSYPLFAPSGKKLPPADMKKLKAYIKLA